MRLVLVVSRFPQLSETFIASKFAGLVDAGWDAHIVCAEEGSWDDFPRLAARPDLRRRVHRQWPHVTAWKAALLWPLALATAFLRAPRATVRYWRDGRRRLGRRVTRRFYIDAAIIALSPDIIHFEFGSQAVGRTDLGDLLGSRLSVSFRGYDLNFSGLNDPDYYAALWRDVDAVHVLGQDLWRRALRRGCPADKPRAMIPPAIDVEMFRPAKTDASRDAGTTGTTERPLRVLSVGRLEWKKGYEYGLAAIRHLTERGFAVEYRIVGGGTYFEPLIFACHQLGLGDRVVFLGSQPHDAVVEHMRWADALLHPAVSEGFCNAVLEAQAMRLPVVVGDAGGLPENVEDGRTGFVVARRDPAAMAEKLALLAKDGPLRREMGGAGRARVERCFALPQQIAEFDRFFREMVAGHAR